MLKGVLNQEEVECDGQMSVFSPFSLCVLSQCLRQVVKFTHSENMFFYCSFNSVNF